MQNVYEKLISCYESIQEKIPFTPKVALVLGSGLGGLRGGKFGWRQNWITMKSTVFRFQPCPDMQENLFLDGSDPFRWCA